MTAPNNPFNQAIVVNTPAVGADSDSITWNHDRRAVVGAVVKLPADWKLEGDVTWNLSRTFNQGAFDRATPVLTAGVQNGSLDILRDPALFPVDFSPLLARSVLLPPRSAPNVLLGGNSFDAPYDALENALCASVVLITFVKMNARKYVESDFGERNTNFRQK